MKEAIIVYISSLIIFLIGGVLHMWYNGTQFYSTPELISITIVSSIFFYMGFTAGR